MSKPRIGISACLLGHEVRWDGGHKRDAFLTELLGPWVEWVPVCPEVELGLGAPRETLQLTGRADAPRLVATRSGTDHTDAMVGLARARADGLARAQLAGFVFKKNSPSCGMERVPVHRGKGAPARHGTGIFARELMRRLDPLPVEEEGRLHDPVLRENFVERIFAYRRWQDFAGGRPTRGGLVRFHTAHKLTLLAHDPKSYRRLGALVARAKARPLGDVVAAYGAGFMRALRVPATRGRHANVLEHMLGYVSAGLDAAERREMTSTVADYRRGLVPLVVPLTLVRHHARRLAVAYLLEQVYLDPDPKELMLRNHV
ncbi:MAG TPA: DUF523 and DUF1722 domain-containing protein [Candidatus Binatia bacterium]|nr:DUF523 and DUF1722 domain-containing protein [Candidatus Binatia bacterium]